MSKNIIDKIILTDSEIKAIVTKLSNKINNSYQKGKRIEVLVLLEGAKTFSQDIFSSNNIDLDKFHISHVRVKSYNGINSEDVKISKEDLSFIKDKEVLIIDDIYETGKTLSSFCKYIRTFNPESIKTCVLLERDSEHEEQINIDFLGVIVKNQDFLIGYGLDYNGDSRDLPLIATLKKV